MNCFCAHSSVLVFIKINTKITFSWAQKQFATRLHTLFSMNTFIKYELSSYRHRLIITAETLQDRDHFWRDDRLALSIWVKTNMQIWKLHRTGVPFVLLVTTSYRFGIHLVDMHPRNAYFICSAYEEICTIFVLCYPMPVLAFGYSCLRVCVCPSITSLSAR